MFLVGSPGVGTKTNTQMQLCLTLLEDPSEGDPAGEEDPRLWFGGWRCLFPRRHAQI